MKPCTRVLIALLALAPCAEAAKLRVPQQYQLIQHAMLAANHGDSVIVSKGVYRENVSLSGFHDVTLVGMGRVIIDVLGSRVTVSNNRISDCTYTGITVFDDPAGGDVAHNLICGNEIQAVSEGVHVHNAGAKDNSILGNKIVKTRDAEMA